MHLNANFLTSDIMFEKYYMFGKLHRTDGPALVTSKENIYYYFKGKLHNQEHPSLHYGSKVYCKHGLYHRLTKPSYRYVNYYKNIVKYKQYNVLHRIDGNAEIYIHDQNTTACVYRYYHGKLNNIYNNCVMICRFGCCMRDKKHSGGLQFNDELEYLWDCVN